VPVDPKTAREHRVVGIIGGMGPEATVELMRRVIAKTPAHGDEDHIHLIVESNPRIPSRIAHLIEHTGADPTPELVRIAINLQRAGADALAIPCNTAHAYAHSIRHAVDIPLLDMIQLTVDRIGQHWPAARVGLLASTAVHNTNLYADALAAKGMGSVTPADQLQVMELIKAVKRGDTGVQTRAAFKRLTLEFASHADVLLVACSELSVIADAITSPFVDSVDVLADHIVQFAGVERSA
jgi:aspartate racemase